MLLADEECAGHAVAIVPAERRHCPYEFFRNRLGHFYVRCCPLELAGGRKRSRIRQMGNDYGVHPGYRQRRSSCSRMVSFWFYSGFKGAAQSDWPARHPAD